MTARVTEELSVGLTGEMLHALIIATQFQGMKPSQYGRQAILERLVREGFLQHPAQALMNAANGSK
jgi:hypothetical protein